MFYLNFIPEWVFHLLLLIGFGGIIVSAVMRNALILPIAFFIFVSALFVEGVVFGQADMRRQVAEMEAKIQTLTAESKQVNVQLVEKYKTNIVKIKEKSNEIIKYVDKYVTQYDNDCRVPNAFVVLHDSAAKAIIPDSAAGIYEGTSDVKISEVGKTVAENYGAFHETREQVKAWQEWYTVQKGLFDKVYNNN